MLVKTEISRGKSVNSFHTAALPVVVNHDGDLHWIHLLQNQLTYGRDHGDSMQHFIICIIVYLCTSCITRCLLMYYTHYILFTYVL